MRRQIKLISALWGCMLGSMLLIGLIFQFPLLSHLSSSLTTGLEEMIFIAIALILNRDWLQQPLTYSLTATWRQRLHPLEPTLIVTGLNGWLHVDDRASSEYHVNDPIYRHTHQLI